MSWVESNIRASQLRRYRDAIAIQGFAFIELRTPPAGLALGDRPRDLKYPPGPIDDGERLLVLPPAELFGEHRHPWTAGVLAGTENITWGWPEVER